MEICINQEHKMPHELPCACCSFLCPPEHEIVMEVFIGPGIASMGDRPVEVLTATP